MPRASWRGYLRLSLVSCPIYLSPATARTKPIRLHQVWRGAPDEGDGELEDQVGGQDASERLASGLTPDYFEDRGGTNTSRNSNHASASRSQRRRRGRERRGRQRVRI